MGQPARKHRVRTATPASPATAVPSPTTMKRWAMPWRWRSEPSGSIELDAALAVRRPTHRIAGLRSETCHSLRSRCDRRAGENASVSAPPGQTTSRSAFHAALVSRRSRIGGRDQHLRTPAVEPAEVVRHHRRAAPARADRTGARPRSEARATCGCCRRAAARCGAPDTAPSARRAPAWSSESRECRRPRAVSRTRGYAARASATSRQSGAGAPAIAAPDTRARRHRGRRACRSAGAHPAAHAAGARRAPSSRCLARSKSASVKTATRIPRPPHVETEFAQALGKTAREVACWGGRRAGWRRTGASPGGRRGRSAPAA